MEDYEQEILEISKRLDNASYDDDLKHDILDLNNQLIDTCNKSYSDIFEIVTKQYNNNKHLYSLGRISQLDYNKFKKTYHIEKLKQLINEGLKFSYNYNYEDISILISSLKKYCKNSLIEELSDNYVEKVTSLYDKISSHLNNSIFTDQKKYGLISAMHDLSDNYLAPILGHNISLTKQEIIVSITLLSEDFSKENPKFNNKKNKEVFDQCQDSFDKYESAFEMNKDVFEKHKASLKEKTFIIKNNHIKELDICENVYGVNGRINFELAYGDQHSDFEFLFDSEQLLLLDIYIVDTFKLAYAESSKDDKVSITKFSVIGTIGDNSHVHHKFRTNFQSEEISENHCLLKEFTIKFKDPLATLWNIHKPTYIDYDKNLQQIIDNNFHFGDIIKIEISTSMEDVMKQDVMEQVFISSINRSFYDFFIEQLYLNDYFIKYCSDPESGIPTYFITDKIDNKFEESFKNTQKDVSNKLNAYDRFLLRSQDIIPDGLDKFISKNIITPDINILGDSITKDKLYETILEPVNYLNYENVNEYKLNPDKCVSILQSRNDLSFLNTHLDLSKIDLEGIVLKYKSVDIKSVYLSEKRIHLLRSKHCSSNIYKSLTNLSYEKDQKEEYLYEQISWCTNRDLTHVNVFNYSFRGYEKRSDDHQRFIPYNSFDMIAAIIISSNNDLKLPKAYKFFNKFKFDEVSPQEHQEDEEKNSDIILNSKEDLLYALRINSQMLAPECKDDPIIFLPVRININSSVNEFEPLRNGDIVKVTVDSITSCHITEIISNSAVSLYTTDEQHIQRKKFGADENCVVGYTEDKDDETYSITQTNNDNDNSILINDNNGIFITYTAKDSK